GSRLRTCCCGQLPLYYGLRSTPQLICSQWDVPPSRRRWIHCGAGFPMSEPIEPTVPIKGATSPAEHTEVTVAADRDTAVGQPAAGQPGAQPVSDARFEPTLTAVTGAKPAGTVLAEIQVDEPAAVAGYQI